jgi:hypothetical protein
LSANCEAEQTPSIAAVNRCATQNQGHVISHSIFV